MNRRSSPYLSRRHMLVGMASFVGTGVWARAPETSERPLARGLAAPRPVRAAGPPTEALVQKAGLGGQVGYAVTDVDTGEVLDMRLGDTLLPPASTMKAITAIYALDKLGPSYRFRTEVLARGTMKNGRLEGDLILKGGGDPTLDTDRLADLAAALREAGLHEVTGRFLIWPGDMPADDRIDDEQPDHVSYNPAFGGLNLNFNRVHFKWERAGDGYSISMQARGLRFSPSTSVAQMGIVDRKTPVYDYWASRDRDVWSVARGALGSDGARWLPVRFPAIYAADVFRTLARSNGIVLKPAERIDMLPEAKVLAVSESEHLVPVLVDMLKYSTNLTAEMTGLAASMSYGVPSRSLAGSGGRMASWAMENFDATGLRFKDHSGLGYGSAITPMGMARILRANDGIAVLLKDFNLSLDKSRPAPGGVRVRAKTGTLNFVSSLAGFVETRNRRKLSFAIFTGDVARRDAIPQAERERPNGAKSWSRRSRQLQKELIRSWAQSFDA
ncbi:MAG: D-alanyl-D-alanine carboxypeptidase [Boseongicola sp.]|nr:D-alanyl-D-alanine carboxypeptidase [Boseongicola sp.]